MFRKNKLNFDDVEQYQKELKRKHQYINNSDSKVETRGMTFKEKYNAVKEDNKREKKALNRQNKSTKGQTVEKQSWLDKLNQSLETKVEDTQQPQVKPVVTSESPRSLGNTQSNSNKSKGASFLKRFIVMAIGITAISTGVDIFNEIRNNTNIFNNGLTAIFDPNNNQGEWPFIESNEFLQLAQQASDNNIDHIFTQGDPSDLENRLLEAINNQPFSITMKHLGLDDTSTMKWLCPINNEGQRLFFHTQYCGVFLLTDLFNPSDYMAYLRANMITINTNLLLDASPDDIVYFISGEYYSRDQINAIQEWYLNKNN